MKRWSFGDWLVVAILIVTTALIVALLLIEGPGK